METRATRARKAKGIPEAPKKAPTQKKGKENAKASASNKALSSRKTKKIEKPSEVFPNALLEQILASNDLNETVTVELYERVSKLYSATLDTSGKGHLSAFTMKLINLVIKQKVNESVSVSKLCILGMDYLFYGTKDEKTRAQLVSAYIVYLSMLVETSNAASLDSFKIVKETLASAKGHIECNDKLCALEMRFRMKYHMILHQGDGNDIDMLSYLKEEAVSGRLRLNDKITKGYLEYLKQKWPKQAFHITSKAILASSGDNQTQHYWHLISSYADYKHDIQDDLVNSLNDLNNESPYFIKILNFYVTSLVELESTAGYEMFKLSTGSNYKTYLMILDLFFEKTCAIPSDPLTTQTDKEGVKLFCSLIKQRRLANVPLEVLKWLFIESSQVYIGFMVVQLYGCESNVEVVENLFDLLQNLNDVEIRNRYYLQLLNLLKKAHSSQTETSESLKEMLKMCSVRCLGFFEVDTIVELSRRLFQGNMDAHVPYDDPNKLNVSCIEFVDKLLSGEELKDNIFIPRLESRNYETILNYNVSFDNESVQSTVDLVLLFVKAIITEYNFNWFMKADTLPDVEAIRKVLSCKGSYLVSSRHLQMVRKRLLVYLVNIGCLESDPLVDLNVALSKRDLRSIASYINNPWYKKPEFNYLVAKAHYALGNYNESIDILLKCFGKLKSSFSTAKGFCLDLNNQIYETLVLLTECYYRRGSFRECRYIIQEGLQIAKSMQSEKNIFEILSYKISKESNQGTQDIDSREIQDLVLSYKRLDSWSIKFDTLLNDDSQLSYNLKLLKTSIFKEAYFVTVLKEKLLQDDKLLLVNSETPEYVELSLLKSRNADISTNSVLISRRFCQPFLHYWNVHSYIKKHLSSSYFRSLFGLALSREMNLKTIDTETINSLPQNTMAFSIAFSAAEHQFVYSFCSTTEQFNWSVQFTNDQITKLKNTLSDILKHNDEINKEGAACTSIEQKKKWWNERFALDKKLGDFLRDLEYSLKLNRIKDMFRVMNTASEDINEVLCALTEFAQKKLGSEAKATILSLLYLNYACGSATLTDSQLTEVISTILQNLLGCKESTKSVRVDNEDLAEFKQIIDSMMFLDFKKHFREPKHLFIVLDKNICSFPLENIPSLRNYSISRVPSFEILENMLQAVSTETRSLDYRISCKNTFYLLNPSTDLKNTENRFESLLKADDSWDGIVGKIPDNYNVIQKVRQSDMFLYFGHGGAEKYIKSNELRSNGPRKLPCVLLFGCSSGYLKEVGQFDPYGTVYDYIAGGSPSVLVNLWNVTDKDLDRFTLGLFHNWGLLRTGGKEVEAPKNLAESLMRARDECKLRYLTGCAPVLYGIPVSLINAE